MKIADMDADVDMGTQLWMQMRMSDGHIHVDEGADADIFIYCILYLFSIGSDNFQPQKSNLCVTRCLPKYLENSARL